MIIAHPRVCDEFARVDLHFHVFAEVKPHNLDAGVKYLKQRHSDVWTHSRGTKRDFSTVAHYMRKHVAGLGVNSIVHDKDLLELYQQTHGLRYVYPRGAFRKFLAKWRRERKLERERHKPNKRTGEKPERQNRPKVGSRVVGIAPVWFGEERELAVITETYGKPGHLTDLTPVIPETYSPSLSAAVPESNLEESANMMTFSSEAQASLRSLHAAIEGGARCTAVWWPQPKDVSSCDQNLVLAVARDLLAAQKITSVIDPNVSSVRPPLVTVFKIDTPQKESELLRHLQCVATDTLGIATRITRDIERIGRVVTDAAVGGAATDIRHAIVREILRESGLHDSLSVKACDLADAIANQVAVTPASSTTTVNHQEPKPAKPRPAPDAGATPASPSATTDDQRVKSATKAKKSGPAKPTPAPEVGAAPASPSATTDDQRVKATTEAKKAKPAKPAKPTPAPEVGATPASPSATTDDQRVKATTEAKKAKPAKPTPAPEVGATPASPSATTDDQRVKATTEAKKAKPAKPTPAPEVGAAPASSSATTDDQRVRPATKAAKTKPAKPTPAPEVGAAPASPSATTDTTKSPRLEAPPTQPANPNTANPDTANPKSTALWEQALANRPRMRVEIDLWPSPPLSPLGCPHADLVAIKAAIEANYPDFRVRIWPFASPIDPPFYVELDGVSSPPERARWRRHIENMVAAHLLPPAPTYQTHAERLFARLISKDLSVEKWIRTKRGEFQIELGLGEAYEPDFVVETEDQNLVVEVSARAKVHDPVVKAKAAAATKWCASANELNVGKRWTYALVPDDVLKNDVTLDDLITRCIR